MSTDKTIWMSGLLTLVVYCSFTNVAAVPSVFDLDSPGLDQQFTTFSDIPFIESPVDPELVKALEHINKGQFKEAKALAERKLTKDSKSAPALEILGVAYVLLGDTNQGLEKLKLAVKVNPMQSTAYTKVGDIYLSQGEYEQAREQYVKAKQINPNDRLNYQRLGIIAEKAKQYPQAIDYYERGIQGTPKEYVGVKTNLAALYNRMGRFNDAIKLLGSITAAEQGKSPVSLMVLGYAYLGINQVEKAIDHFQRAMKQHPKNVYGRTGLGIAYRRNGQFEKSLSEFQTVTQLQSKDPLGYYQIAETYFGMGEFSKAMKFYKQARTHSPRKEFVDKRIADLSVAEKKYSNAIELYNKLLKEKNSLPALDLYIALGLAHQKSGDYQSAETAFKKLIDNYPKQAAGYYFLGSLYGYNKQYDAGITTLTTGLQYQPKDIRLLKAMSLLQSRAGDKVAAISYARRITQEAPNHIPSLFYLASLLDENNNAKEAMEIYQKILDKSPDYVPALNNLANLLANENQLENAYDLSKKAYKLSPQDPFVIDTHGWILYNKGQLDMALKHLHQAAKLSPKNPTIFYHLGVVYHVKKDTRAAKKNLTKALQLSDSFREADQARELLSML